MEKIDFLCINCQELISQKDLFMHSVVCVYPTPQILQNEQNCALDLINFKLDKLKSALKRILTAGHEKVETEILEFLINKIENLDLINLNVECFENCKGTYYTLERYSQAKLSSFILIYIERLKTLVQEALIELEKEIDELKVNQLDLKYREIQRAKADVMGNNISPSHNIDEISSQISKIWKIGTSSAPDSEVNEQDVDDIDQMMRINESEMGKKNEEDLMRYFYSKCLAVKMSNPPAVGQNIQIMELYRKVVESKIPVGQWESFIKQQFFLKN